MHLFAPWIMAALTFLNSHQPAHADRHRAPRVSRSAPRTPPPQRHTGLNWAALRRCESGGDYHNKRNARYRGGYQFSYGTWRSVGGTGDPADAPPAEQDARAQLLYQRRGRQPWPVCGRLL